MGAGLRWFAVIACAAVWQFAGTADAGVKRVITFTHVPVADSLSNSDAPPAVLPNYNLIRVDGGIAVGTCPFDPPETCPPLDDPVPLTPQKDGVQPGQSTFHGLPSDRTYLGASPNNEALPTTFSAIVNFEAGVPTRLQVYNSKLIFDHSGNYCPGDGSDTPQGTLRLEEYNPNPADEGYFDLAEECPYEESGGMGIRVGVNDGSIEAVVRDIIFNMKGASDVAGSQIDSLNWHFFLDPAWTDTDGRGALDCTGAQDPGNDSANDDNCSEAVHGYAAYPDLAAHNERDPDAGPEYDVDESTYFKGQLLSLGGEDYELNFPIMMPIYLVDEAGYGKPNPEEFIRLSMRTLEAPGTLPTKGLVRAQGTLAETLLEGDANRDGVVDGLDANIVSLHWRRGEGHTHNPNDFEPHTCIEDCPHGDYPPGSIHKAWAIWDEGDVDLSTVVDQADLDVIAGNFGATAGAGAGSAGAVPEPAGLTLALLALAGSLLTVRRRG